METSIRAVLVNEDGLVLECFGFALDDGPREELLADRQHPIHELELFPVMVALRIWSLTSKNSQVTFYLDDGSCKKRAGQSEWNDLVV